MLDGLAAARVFVTNLDRSATFYRDVLGLSAIFTSETAAMFETGQTKLIIELADPNDPEEATYVGRFCGLSFEVADMQSVYDSLRGRGVKFDGPPETQEWGGILAHLHDPDGNVLSLVANPPA